jgi:hypothetical protein
MFLPELYLFILAAEIFIAMAVGFFTAFYLNVALETPEYRFLISSALIAGLTFLVTDIFCHYALQPLLWFERDNSWRMELWDHRPEIIAAVVAAFCLAAWQFAVRKTDRCRFPI